MMNKIKQFTDYLVNRLFQRTSHPQRPFQQPRMNMDEVPPFEGTAEEALYLLQMPPVAKVKVQAVVRVGEQGITPELIEQFRLTKIGKVLARTECLAMDDHGQIGRPADLKGNCGSCYRISFRGAPCPVCNAFTCSGCLGKNPDLRCCPRCARVIRFHNDNWTDKES